MMAVTGQTPVLFRSRASFQLVEPCHNTDTSNQGKGSSSSPFHLRPLPSPVSCLLFSSLSLFRSFNISFPPPPLSLHICPPPSLDINHFPKEPTPTIPALTDIRQSQTRGGRGGWKQQQRRGLAQRQTACRGRETFPRSRLSRLLR